jgi:hypothetical protein
MTLKGKAILDKMTLETPVVQDQSNPSRTEVTNAVANR